MKQLTYAEIELLQYILKMHITTSDNIHKEYLDSLYNKLIAMRAQVERSRNNIELSSEEINNSL